MPKRNSSGSSEGRRGSSRSTSGGKSFKGRDDSSKRPFKGGKSSSASSARSFKKDGDSSFKKSDFKKSDFKRTDRKRSGEGFPAKSERPYSSDRSENKSGSRPYKKFDSKSSGRSFGKRSDEGFSEKRKGKFSSTGDDRKSSFEKKRYGSREEGSFRSPKKFGKGAPGKREQGSDERDERGSFDKKRSAPREEGSFRGTAKSGKPSARGKKEYSDERPKRSSFSKGKSFGSKRSKEDFNEDAPVQTEKIRLNKYIANSGVCSRREADELITMGLISVNGKTITELGYKVNPGDEVRYESKVLKAEKPVYILLNKPKGFLTTTSDPQERNTVMHILGDAVKERVYPVGRLDRNTTGLLLLTNDGDLADKLMHPSYNVKKIYKVELDRPLTKADYQKIREGVHLEEGRAMVDDLAIISEDGKTVGIELHIGWNRVVRRIFEAMEYEVIKLDRSVYAGLDKRDLPRGHWRFLKKEEVVRLKHYQ